MKTFIHAAVMVSSLGALAPLASAQAANAASQVAAQVTAHVPPPPPVTVPPAAVPPVNVPPVNPPPVNVPPVTVPAATAGVAVNAGPANGAASVAVPANPVTLPANSQAGAHASGNSAVSGSLPGGVNAGVGGAAGTPNAGLTSTASTVLNPAATVQSIREAAFASRNALATEIGSRLDASQRAIAALEARAAQTADRSRSALARALGEVRAREKDLRASLRDTVKTTRESTWGDVQSALASTYGTYAQAVADAEAAAQAEITASK
jgi:hypothetical protein